uniref:Exostosin GT47 domain-containing protein n=1 Tax=viral metagenome TaxID=1070528 RepID=A0A6C0CLP7_9ZZZZ
MVIIKTQFHLINSDVTDPDQIITGEALQRRCDYFLADSLDHLRVNPNMHSEIDKKGITPNTLPIELTTKTSTAPVFIYCKSDRVPSKEVFLRIAKEFYLVLHNSDGNVIWSKYAYLVEIPNLLRVFAQNCTIDHPKFEPIPIGIANSMWPHGNLKVLLAAIKRIKNGEIPKRSTVYYNCKIHNACAPRIQCDAVMTKKGIKNQPAVPYPQYLETLASYKYAICPEGGGIDTHRLWECLYLGVTPIVLRNYMTEYFNKHLDNRLILLDKWEDLDLSTL